MKTWRAKAEDVGERHVKGYVAWERADQRLLFEEKAKTPYEILIILPDVSVVDGDCGWDIAVPSPAPWTFADYLRANFLGFLAVIAGLMGRLRPFSCRTMTPRSG